MMNVYGSSDWLTNTAQIQILALAKLRLRNNSVLEVQLITADPSIVSTGTEHRIYGIIALKSTSSTSYKNSTAAGAKTNNIGFAHRIYFENENKIRLKNNPRSTY